MPLPALLSGFSNPRQIPKTGNAKRCGFQAIIFFVYYCQYRSVFSPKDIVYILTVH